MRICAGRQWPGHIGPPNSPPALPYLFERFSHFEKGKRCVFGAHKATTKSMNKYMLQFPHKSIPCYFICSHSCLCKAQKWGWGIKLTLTLHAGCQKYLCGLFSIALKCTQNIVKSWKAITWESDQKQTWLRRTTTQFLPYAPCNRVWMLKLKITLHANLILTHKCLSFAGRQTKPAK